MQRHNLSRYVVFEGPDGSGKSTLMTAVRQRLADAVGPTEVNAFTFPTHTTAPGQLIRRVFTGTEAVTEKGLAYLLMADLVEMDFTLRMLHSQGGFILADRHPLVSGWVYQTEVYGVDHVLAYQGRSQFLYPERVFIMDVPAEVQEERIMKRAEARNQIYEKKDPSYQDRLRKKYLAYAIMHPTHTHVLDGTKPVDMLVAEVIDVINSNGAV